MSVKYKVIERGQPGVPGGGTKKFYAAAVLSGEKTLAGLTRDIEKISTVSGADIRAVLYALVDVIAGRRLCRPAGRIGQPSRKHQQREQTRCRRCNRRCHTPSESDLHPRQRHQRHAGRPEIRKNVVGR